MPLKDLPKPGGSGTSAESQSVGPWHGALAEEASLAEAMRQGAQTGGLGTRTGPWEEGPSYQADMERTKQGLLRSVSGWEMLIMIWIRDEKRRSGLTVGKSLGTP